MTNPIRFAISGRNAETDAPTVEDLLDQVGDYFGILRGVEEALADDGASEIDWRVTDASKHSPLELEMTPFPRRHGVDIEQRAQLVRERTAQGLALLITRAERPRYFTEPVLEKAERLFRRVTNGLCLTKIDYGADVPAIEINPMQGRSAAANVGAVRKPKEKPYREIGSVEGILRRVERDGYGRSLLFIKRRIDGETVKCIVRDEAEAEVEHHEIGEVWENQRVRVFGTIHYKSLGRITQVESDRVQFLRKRGELPNADDIIDPNFTNGLGSEDYLERLRNGELS